MKHHRLPVLFASLFMLLTPCYALEINVSEPGSLRDLILDSDDDISTLTIKGTLNADDVAYLSGNSGKIAQVQELDLSEIKLVESESEPYRRFTIWAEAGGGEYAVCYYSQNARVEYTSSTGGLGMPILTWHIYGTDMAGLLADTNFKKVTLPQSASAVGDYMCLRAYGLEEVVIPENASAIGDMAFQHTGIKSIAIPQTVKSIGSSAFENTPISAVELPAGLASIGSQAFRICDKLTAINLGNVREIGNDAFQGASALTAVNISSLERVESRTFLDCPLNSLELSKNLKFVGDQAFYLENFNLRDKVSLKTLDFPEGIDSIGSMAFMGTKLTNVSIPVSTSYIGRDAFKDTPWDNSLVATAVDNVVYLGNIAYKVVNRPSTVNFREGTVSVTGNVDLSYTRELTLPSSCTSLYAINYDLIEKADLGNGLKIIGDECFKNARNLTEITLPESLEYIGDGAFSSSGLKSLTLPQGIKHIGGEKDSYSSAFANIAISSITLPEGLEYIGKNAFSDCSSLSTVRFNCRNVQTAEFGRDQWSYITPMTFRASAVEKIVIGPEVEKIPSGLFSDIRWTLSRVEFEDSDLPLEIGDYCIAASGRYGDQVAKVKGSLDRVTSLGNDAIEGLEFPAGTRLDFPNLKSIGTQALRRISGVQSITFNSGIEHIGYYVIVSPTGLMKVKYDIPNGVMTTPETWDAALMQSVELDSLIIGSNVETIGKMLFDNVRCNTLVFEPRTQSRAASSLSIGDGAFQFNKSLSCVDFPSDLVALGERAFAECPQLYTVYFHSQAVPTIGEGAIHNTSTVYVPAEVESSYRTSLSSNTVRPYTLESVELDKSALKLKKGESNYLIARINPSECSEMSIEWTTSNPAVVTVNSRGDVVAVGEGQAVITAAVAFDNSFKADCLVTVEGDSGIGEIEAGNECEVVGIYTIDGICVERPSSPGIYIVRLSDGTTNKMIIK